jgi:galactitol-specific phosphotransferase system IIB component
MNSVDNYRRARIIASKVTKNTIKIYPKNDNLSTIIDNKIREALEDAEIEFDDDYINKLVKSFEDDVVDKYCIARNIAFNVAKKTCKIYPKNDGLSTIIENKIRAAFKDANINLNKIVVNDLILVATSTVMDYIQ